MEIRRYRVITISGEIATGKSTIAEELSHELGWERINTGDRFRAFLQEKGKTVQDVSFLPDEVHKEFDSHQKQLAATGSHLIVEGRLSGWLSRDMDTVFKIFCCATIEVRAQRYAKREDVTIDEAIKQIEFRDNKDANKYKKMYGVEDYRDAMYYNMILDTSQKKPVELVDMILKKLDQV